MFAEATKSRLRNLITRYSGPEASVAQLLCDEHDPSRIAYNIIDRDLSAHPISYGELQADSERVSNGLRALGIGPGDRVATLMGKSRNYIVALMSIWRLGAVHVPLFTAFAPAAIAMRLSGSQAKAIICDASQYPKLTSDETTVRGDCKIITSDQNFDAPADTIPFFELLASKPSGIPMASSGADTPFIEIYTSGTTGKPKGVIVPVRALASFQAYAEFGLDVRPDDVFWNAADPGWAYGLYFGILGTLTTGVPSILYEGGFSPEAAFEILARYGVTNFTAAPTVYRSLRASGLPLPKSLKLRCASSAGEPLTPDVNEWASSALGVEVYDHYGQTEAGMLINNHHHPDLCRPLKSGSMGQAMPGWAGTVLKHDSDDVALVGEVGRVAIDMTQSPLAWFKGYADDPEKSCEKFSSDGRWYVTGDVGRLDDEGYFYFSSRDDDVIIMAGYRIGPFEVESVLLRHPAVRECAVIAAPDAVRGEVLEAVVVLHLGYGATSELTKELQTWVKTNYAAHAYPRRVHYIGELPRTPSGKVQRFIIREQIRQSSSETQS